MEIQFFGAAGEVTGSCYLITVGNRKLLVECGLIQGSREHERHNSDPFPFLPSEIDAVLITHAHLDHSGRLPLLIKRGYKGPIYTHKATADLCKIMLEDAGYLNEKEVEWENRKRERKGDELLEPLYTRDDARDCLEYFKVVEYGRSNEILPGVSVTWRDAGHILGSAIIEIECLLDGIRKKIVFSGDLGHKGAPILRDPELVNHADFVVMESTYGNRKHRPWNETWNEMGEIIREAGSGKGNILIPAFTVGRTQELLYIFNQYFEDWNLGNWQIFLDSPMGIEATRVYSEHSRIYDSRAKHAYETSGDPFNLPNLHMSHRSQDSMKINLIRSGAIIIAGSGMCTGGRIKHHLKHNIWREHTHLMIVGYQARGTLGRALVDGAEQISLWGETIQVKAKVHTIGGLSAHADQQGLLDWYSNIENRPRVALVHGEPEAMGELSLRLKKDYGADVVCPEFRQKVHL